MSTNARFTLRGRNPDVLSCIANLSNDEVFTPPEFANRMLDTLAEGWAASHNGADIWADPTVTFLDPCTKSGVFLREITRRLIDGLATHIPALEARVEHILTTQVYGIAITQITSLLARRSLYCSKHAQGSHSIAKTFASDAGNVWFERLQHTWDGDKCRYCGAGKSVFNRAEGLESHAYAFIHADNINTRLGSMFGGKMQFDVIIGNPPYQLASDGGTRDIPIYNKFVEQAKKLQPKFLTMVIPARWMASGLGLTDFRTEMLNDKNIRALVDYPTASDVFPSVEVKGGVCYFLWDANHTGDCAVTTIRSGDIVGPISRDLSEYDVFVRDARALTILQKILAKKEKSVNTILARDKEFGWTSNFDGFHANKQSGDVPLHYVKKSKRDVGYIARKEITKSAQLIDTWKVLVPKAGSDGGQKIPDVVLGKPLIASSPSVCTQSFLFFYIDSQTAAESVKSFYATKFFRYLVSLRKLTQDATHSTYQWVPMQTWDRIWTDEMLYAKYGITAEEQAFIASQIKEMKLEGSDDE